MIKLQEENVTYIVSLSQSVRSMLNKYLHCHTGIFQLTDSNLADMTYRNLQWQFAPSFQRSTCILILQGTYMMSVDRCNWMYDKKASS